MRNISKPRAFTREEIRNWLELTSSNNPLDKNLARMLLESNKHRLTDEDLLDFLVIWLIATHSVDNFIGLSQHHTISRSLNAFFDLCRYKYKEILGMKSVRPIRKNDDDEWYE